MRGRPPFLQFMSDSGAAGLLSLFAALVSLIISVAEKMFNNPLPAYWFLFSSAILWSVGAYWAWRKKGDELRTLEETLKYPSVNVSVEQAIINLERGDAECFVRVRLHNLTPDVVTRILTFKCEIEVDGKHYGSICPQGDLVHFEHVLYSSADKEVSGSKPILGVYGLHPGDLHEQLQRGIDRTGWMHFVIYLPWPFCWPEADREAGIPPTKTHISLEDIKHIRLSAKDSFDRWHVSAARPYKPTDNEGIRVKDRL